MDQPSPQATGRSPLWMRITLVASLALNVALVALIGGAVMRGGQTQAATDPGHDFRLYVAAMPDEHRRELRRAFGRHLGYLKEQRGEILERQEQLITLLRERQLDEARLKSLMDAQLANWMALGQRGQLLIIERVQVMSPEDRTRFADNIENRPERRDRRWDRRQKPRHEGRGD